MKKIFAILAVSFMAAVVLISCKKSSEDPYPATYELYGFWSLFKQEVGENAVNTFGYLVIEPNLGGSEASLRVFDDKDSVIVFADGQFVYDEDSGEGFIASALGGDAVTFQTLRGEKQLMEMKVSRVDSEGEKVEVYLCSAQTLQRFPVGIWYGAVTKPESAAYNTTLTISSTTQGNCGKLEYTERDYHFANLGHPVTYFTLENGVDTKALSMTNQFDGHAAGIGSKSGADFEYNVTGITYFVKDEVPVDTYQYSGAFKVVSLLPGRMDEEIVFVRAKEDFSELELFHEFNGDLYISKVSAKKSLVPENR